LPATIVAAVLGIQPALAQRVSAVKDDFAGRSFSANWFVCHRDESSFAVIAVPGQSFRAARMTVNHRLELGFIELAGHERCRPEDGGPYDVRIFDERAEIWEADALKLPFGTEIWYRFDMWIDPAIPADDDNRLVIGQWKEDGSRSPIVAQRFVDRRFTIDVEQDNDDPATAYAGNTDCRIYIAHDSPFAALASAVGVTPSYLGGALEAHAGFFAGSMAHDPQDTVHAALPASESSLPTCAREISVTPHNLLPDVFGRWTRMLYHMKATADASGRLEVWADDQPIVTVTGRIGFRDHRLDQQYFKFGPYRDHAPYATVSMLANYARGSTRKDVE